MTQGTRTLSDESGFMSRLGNDDTQGSLKNNEFWLKD
jgi:hypothetical protein